MPGPYSGDPRRRAVAAALERGKPSGLVATHFQVGPSTVCRWVEAAREQGRLEAKLTLGGLNPVIRDGVEAALVLLVAADDHLTLAGYAGGLPAGAARQHHRRAQDKAWRAP
jgi:transposase